MNINRWPTALPWFFLERVSAAALALFSFAFSGYAIAKEPFGAEDSLLEKILLVEEAQQQAEGAEISDSQEEELIEVSEVEKRACFSRAFEISLGQSSPFQFYRLSADFHSGPAVSYGGYLAVGKFGISDINKTSSDYDSQVLNLGGRVVYFFSEELSWYLEGGGGLGAVAGKITLENRLKEDFTSTLLSLYGGLGYQKSYHSGYYWRYQLVGVGYTRPLDAAYGPLMKPEGEFVEENLTGSRAWAFVNLSVGLMF